jgi:tRNA nucleotidyltransferase (CCA-adding enzyme)
MKAPNVRITDPVLREAQEAICSDIKAAGGRALLVGGCVRDAVFGMVAQDIDIEVYGLSPQRLVATLGARFKINLVGQAFGVIKIRGLPIDISVPRRESKTGLGHKGFDVLSDPLMTVEEAASRRDFTMNAMAFDPLTSECLDPYGGMRDIEARVLRHTSGRFVEDPLRVLRGMQFAARYDLKAAPETISLCRDIAPEGLAQERIFGEWRKLILAGSRPSRGLEFLQACRWTRYFPELKALVGCEQDPYWHPEGDVWNHVLCCLDAFASQRIGDEWEDLVVGFAVLCHDFGKPITTRCQNGKLTSKMHEIAGIEPTRQFLRRMTNHSRLETEVLPLVKAHMRPLSLFKSRTRDSAVRRLAQSVKRIDRIARVASADRMGRPPVLVRGLPAEEWLIKRASELKVNDAAPEPLVMGRHLLELGLRPGPRIGLILKACHEAQIDGQFSAVAEGIEFAAGVIAEEL